VEIYQYYNIEKKIMSFAYWLRHEELGETKIKMYKEEELHIPLWIKAEVPDPRIYWESMKLFLQTKMWPQFGRRNK